MDNEELIKLELIRLKKILKIEFPNINPTDLQISIWIYKLIELDLLGALPPLDSHSLYLINLIKKRDNGNDFFSVPVTPIDPTPVLDHKNYWPTKLGKNDK